MNIYRKLMLITALTSVLCGTAVAQDLFRQLNTTGAGARAEGMAGAFIGVADDATALVWNPAGIAVLERPEASFVARAISTSFEVEGSTFSADDNHGVLNFLSAAYPVEVGGRHVVLAIAGQRQIDLWSAGDGFDTTGGVDAFTAGFGVRMTPTIWLGGAANVWFGTSDENYNALSSGSGNDELWTNEFSGFNANFGVMVDLESSSNPKPVKLGATLRTPFTLTDDVTAIASFGGVEIGRELLSADIDMPLMFGVGGSVRIGDNLTLAADYETRLFGDSKFAIASVDFFGDPITDEFFISDHGENLNELRLGAEYLFLLDFGVIPLRGGVRATDTLFSDYDDVGDSIGKVVANSVTLGTGIILDRVSFDAALTVTKIDEEFGTLITFKTTETTGTVSGIVYF